MATESLSTNDKRLHSPEASDPELLARFVHGDDKGAFEAIVVRHQAMVTGVCGRVLSNADDRDDAFQATFFVLARDASKIRRSESLTSWLYGVAYRTAVKAAHRRVRRRECPLTETIAPTDDPLDLIARMHEHRAVDEELNDLPEKYRRPLVLRYLAGRSNAEIAEELGLTVAAVEGRLKRGKNQLRVRLAGRGIGMSVALGAITLSQQTAAASEMLIQKTVEQAIVFQTGAVGVDSSSAELAREVEVAKMAFLGNKVVVMSTVITACFWAGIIGIAAQVGNSSGASGSPNGDVVVQANSPSDEKSQDSAPVLDVYVVSPPDVAPDESAVEVATALNTYAAKRRNALREIESKLERANSLEFIDTPLEEVASLVAEQLQVPVIIDRRALEEDAGLGPDSPITFSMPSVSYRTALRLLLQEAGLVYKIEDEVLIFTTEEAASESADTRFYRLDLKLKPEDDIIKFIESVVEPESWDAVGGSGTITMFNGRLVVSNTQYVHEKIADLLAELRQW